VHSWCISKTIHSLRDNPQRMFLEQLNLWNFRKFGSTEILNRPPDLSIPFKEGLNLLVGENDVSLRLSTP
jgi:hypothetical protein